MVYSSAQKSRDSAYSVKTFTITNRPVCPGLGFLKIVNWRLFVILPADNISVGSPFRIFELGKQAKNGSI